MMSDPTYQSNTSGAFSGFAVEDWTPQQQAELALRTLLGEQAIALEQGEGTPLQPAPLQPIGPVIPPILILKRRVSGKYRSAGTGYQLELRVDVDGSRPLNRMSGDFFSMSGATSTYFGSWVVNAPTVTVTASTFTIEGVGSYTWSTAASTIRVTIPRVTLFMPAADATVQFFLASGSPGATYVCPHVSRFFRSVQWEQDSVAGTVPFLTYNTGSLPQPAGSPVRDLTVVNAFAEAGIEMQVSGGANVINTAAAGPDAQWNDAELHAAMVNHFSLWANVPQWKVYLLVATTHAGGARGIMFDYADGFQRQGCAVFYDAIGGADAATQRAQLRTYIHELGHCFNLLHSWQKNLATPPAPLGPNGGLGDLSWMNYAWRYQPPPPALGGEAAYWANFPFQFTDNELSHLRHAFYRNIILGGNAFATGAAEVDPELFADRIQDNSGLKLELKTKGTFAFGEPVVAEIKLSTTDLRGKSVHPFLHPSDTVVQIAIRQPSGRTVLFRSLIEHCMDEDASVLLSGDQLAIYDSAYIGYGKDGFYFDQPGGYQLRATYTAQDGSQIVSPTVHLRVRTPYTANDEEAGTLLLGKEQGQLLALLGSDAPLLQPGNDALDLLLDKHGKHPLALYARLIKGVNAERDFKQFGQDKVLTVRSADARTSVSVLSSVVDASVAEKGVDNITLNMTMRCLASAQSKAGDLEKAENTLDKMVGVFQKKQLKPHIISQIAAEAAEAKMALKQR